MDTKKDTGIIISIIIVCVVVGGLVYMGMSTGVSNKQDTVKQQSAETTKTDTTTNETVASTEQKPMDTNLGALEKGQKFLAENKTKEGVVTLPDGLQYKVITAGTGPKPTKDQIVKVNYEGTFIDGKIFDSSYKRGQPIEFPVTGVIPGWVEALQLMPVGSTWMVYIPSELAYGKSGAPGAIGPDETLIFKVELIEAHK